jgi:hypothetical protein
MADQTTKGVKIKITKRRVLFLFLLVLGIVSLYYINIYFQPVTKVSFGEVVLEFREDLKEAKKIPITPDESSFNKEFINPSVEKVTVIFKPAEDGTESFYSVEVFEIVNKLYYGYRSINHIPKFETANVTSYESISAEAINPLIVLIHPKYGNETSVKLNSHVAFISAKNDANLGVALRNFDLATEKFIISTLGIKV